MHIAKYRFVVFFICVCVLYLVLPKVYPRVFEPHKADGGISNVVIYDGQMCGKSFQIRVTNDSDIAIFYESGRSTVSLMSLAYTELDGCFKYDDGEKDGNTYWYDVRPTDGKYVYVGGSRAKTVHLYFETADKQNIYNFDFWCASTPNGVRPDIEIK